MREPITAVIYAIQVTITSLIPATNATNMEDPKLLKIMREYPILTIVFAAIGMDANTKTEEEMMAMMMTIDKSLVPHTYI